MGDIVEYQCAENVGGAETDRGVVDQGLCVEMGKVACFRVGCLVCKVDEYLRCPRAVDRVIGLEFSRVPSSGVEATLDQCFGFESIRMNPQGVEGTELDHCAQFDREFV